MRAELRYRARWPLAEGALAGSTKRGWLKLCSLGVPCSLQAELERHAYPERVAFASNHEADALVLRPGRRVPHLQGTLSSGTLSLSFRSFFEGKDEPPLATLRRAHGGRASHSYRGRVRVYPRCGGSWARGLAAAEDRRRGWPKRAGSPATRKAGFSPRGAIKESSRKEGGRERTKKRRRGTTKARVTYARS